nr:copper amine oxidase N-terminal domain-containing protein [uncultured Niameybacter sp.]
MKRKKIAAALLLVVGASTISIWGNELDKTPIPISEPSVSIHQINMMIPITRAEFITVLVQSITGVDQFPPIMDTHYAMPYMQRAEDLGLINLEMYSIKTWSEIMSFEEKSELLSKAMKLENVDMAKVYEAFNQVLIHQVTVDDGNVDLKGQLPTLYKGKVMLPLRTVAEAMGFKVKWDGKNYRAVLSNGKIQSNVEIGFDSYTYESMNAIGMSAPFSAGVAPMLVDGSVYVPSAYFTMFARNTVSDDTIHFTVKQQY